MFVAQFHGMPEQFFRLAVAPLLADDEAQLSQSIRVFRLERERFPESRFGHIVCRATTRRDADEVMRFGNVWKTRRRPLKDLERLIVEIEQHVISAEPYVIDELRGVLLERLFVILSRTFDALISSQYFAEHKVRFREVGTRLERLRPQLRSPFALSTCVLDQSKIVKRFRVIRHERQSSMKRAIGFIKPLQFIESDAQIVK